MCTCAYAKFSSSSIIWVQTHAIRLGCVCWVILQGLKVLIFIGVVVLIYNPRTQKNGAGASVAQG